MIRSVLVSVSVLVSGLLFNACSDQSANSGGKLQAVASAPAAASGVSKLFYDFSLQPLPKYERTIDWVSYSAEVELHVDGDQSRMRVYSGQGGWFFNLKDGSISEYFPHSGGGRDSAAPANGGNVVPYMDMLKLMQTSLQNMIAPASVQAYVAQVIEAVSKAYPYGLDYRQSGEAGRFNVSYIAAAPADILVDAFSSAGDGVRKSSDSWVAKGRATVAAGTGTIGIQIEPPLASGPHCYDMKALPIGGDYSKALAKWTYCDGQRPY